jgi:hypothetical protein
VLLTLVDRRTKIDEAGRDLEQRLRAAIEERGWPRFQTVLSRSPRVEALNSAEGRSLSILHHAQGTLVHRQMRSLAEEVLEDLGLGVETMAARAARAHETVRAPLGGLPLGVTSWKQALLRGLRGR